MSHDFSDVDRRASPQPLQVLLLESPPTVGCFSFGLLAFSSSPNGAFRKGWGALGRHGMKSRTGKLQALSEQHTSTQPRTLKQPCVARQTACRMASR